MPDLTIADLECAIRFCERKMEEILHKKRSHEYDSKFDRTNCYAEHIEAIKSIENEQKEWIEKKEDLKKYLEQTIKSIQT